MQLDNGTGHPTAEPRTESPAEVVEKRVHVFTLRVSPRLAIRVKQQAEIQDASINALLTHWVYAGLRAAEHHDLGDVVTNRM